MNPPGYIGNVVWQVGSRVLTVAANLAVFVLVARRLGADGLGRFSWVMTLTGVFSVLAEFGTTPLLARELARVPDRARYWGTFLLARGALALLLVVPMAAVALVSEEPYRTYIAILLVPMGLIAAKFFDPLFQVYDRPVLAFIPSLVYAVTYCVVAAVVLESLDSLSMVIVAYAAANVAYFSVAMALSRRLVRPVLRVPVSEWRGVIGAAAPIAVSSVFSIVNTRADVFLLAHFRTEMEVGIYNAGYKFLDVAGVAAVVLVTPLIATFSAMFATRMEELKARYQRLLEALGVVLLPIAVLTPVVSPDLIRLVYGGAFLAAAPVVNVLAWVGVLVCFSLLGSALSVAAGILKQAYWNTAVAATLNVALNVLLIPRFSYMASAWATLASEVLLVTICYAYLARCFGNLFRAGYWARILGANALLAVACALASAMPYRYLAIILALACYARFILKRVLGCGLLAHLRSVTPDPMGATT